METSLFPKELGVKSWAGEDSGRKVGFAQCPVCGEVFRAPHEGISERLLVLLAENGLGAHLASHHQPLSAKSAFSPD